MALYTIMVFGVPGVGKSTACERFVSRHPSYLHVSAGGLLREATSLQAEDLRLTPQETIVDRQQMLIDHYKMVLLRQKPTGVLLDAHAVVDNGQEFVRIPTDVIASFSPCGLILLEASPEEIAFRRSNDDRVRGADSLSRIAEHMAEIRATFATYVDELELPHAVASTGDNFELDEIVRTIESGIERNLKPSL